MAILYWSVVIIGIFVIPVVAGYLHAKAMKAYWEGPRSMYSSSRPDLFNYGMGAFVGLIVLFAWPFALPLGCIAGALYLLFKAPQFILDGKEKK